MEKTQAEIIKEARIKAGLSQRKLAQISGVSRQLINFIESGKRKGKSADILKALAKALNIMPQELFGLEDSQMQMGKVIANRVETMFSEIMKDTQELLELPIRGTIPAGYPFPAEQESGEFVEVPRQELGGIAPESLYALTVSGESLQGDGILSGDVVAVNSIDTEIIDGKIYIIRLGNEVCARHVFKQDNYLRLVSSNGDYKEMLATDVEILGRVILSGRWKKH